MGKKSGSQTVTQTPDAGSQAHIDRMRTMGQSAADMAAGGNWFTGPLTDQNIQDAMNPYMDNVIGGVRGEFDHLRGQAGLDMNAAATSGGAFGGSRHAVATGARMGELDRAQTSQIGGLLHQGYGQAQQFAEHQRQLRERQLQNPLFAAQQGMNFMNLGMGPVGSETVQTGQPGKNHLGAAAGGAMTGASIGSIIPGVGTAIGAGVGGLIGLGGSLWG